MRRIRNFLIGLLGPLIVRLWIGTLSVRYLGVDVRDGRLPRKPSGIFVFWHQRMLAFAGIFHHSGFKAVVSEHGDGEMIARICQGLGIHAIRGSSTRGGARAILEILRNTGREACLAITPDGPQGPRHFFHDGTIYIASRTGLTLYPVAVSFARYVQLPTWDGFIIPRPFTRTVIRMGEGILVPPDIEREAIETLRKTVEEKLRELTDSTDGNFTELYLKAKRVKDMLPADAKSD